MELIQIIYDTLILGTFLLFIVVLISFVKYKSKRAERENGPVYLDDVKIVESIIPAAVNIQMNKTVAHENYRSQPVSSADIKSEVPIYRLDQYKTREIKIVRKPTTTPFENERIAQAYSRLNRTNGNSKSNRYTILNEEQKSEQDIRIANFHF